MKSILLFLYLFAIIGSAQQSIISNQEEPPIQIKDNLFSASFLSNIPLSKKLTLQNGISYRKGFYFNTLEIPVLIKYNISERWSTSLGAQSRKVERRNLQMLNIEEPSKYYMTTGTEYKFKNNTTGNLTIGFPFDVNLGLKF
ncbi:hypothetical protein Q4566_00575 [Tamlana sp. 2_MG-2023]|uniref:hypothetical protein n=1 Tax=unclassified Tamlana TaxID=2614803 RepID=UPI0026E11FF1|nr:MULTISPECIES: hypothetical protein [unclassified Tamlana]MDO6758677.1 hypothetical protein [Tamlana sp. 2_MG-2023]MDO6789376.1 hypothetical protein [Tamlana sp. 1_MG-2023]